MTLYTVTFGNREYQVQLNGQQATVNGQPVNATLQALNPNGLHLLRRGNSALELHLSAPDDESCQVLVGGRRLVAHIHTPQRRTGGQAAKAQPGVLTAPMPGLVIEVLVQEGQPVEENQPLLVMESMKMQMQIRAPFAGQISRLNAAAGQQVDKGALLVKVEPA